MPYLNIGDLMDQNNSRKYVSKTVDVFPDEEVEPNKTQIQEDENRTGPITINEELANSTVADSIGDISTQEQDNYSKDNQENAIKVYEDLSSGSEDMRQVIQDIKDKKAPNKLIDRPSTSKRNTEHKIQDISADTLATVDYDPVLSDSDDCQEPSHQPSFVNQSNIIEIASSSEDELNDGQMLETDEESSFRLHFSRSSNRSPVVVKEFEKSEIIFEENNSHSRIDLENNEESHNSVKYERGTICIDSTRNSHEDCPAEFAVVQLHAHPEKQPVSMVDNTFDESNREITPFSTAEVTAIKELTKILEEGDESTDEENSVYGSSNSLHNSGVEMSQLVLEKPDDPSTDSNKHSISIQCTLAAKDLESSNSDKALTMNDSEECVELSEHQRSISVQCTLHEKDAIIEQSVEVEKSSPESLKLKTVKKTYKRRQALVDADSKLAAHETHDNLSLQVEAQGSTSEHQRSTSMHGISADDNPFKDDESAEETRKDEISTSDMVLRTVKKSYKGPKALLDATPKLAVNLTTRKYSRKTKIILFGDSNTEKSNDNLPSITAGPDILVTDDKSDNSQENKVTEETDDEKLVDAERVSNIAKTVEPNTAEILEATPNVLILTENTDG
ncbi:uncharacterized protein LOC125505001, partial [Dendroctonus ponderosae]|uniref:uncharacterized protein LOC125505001 n=1 Tax=Dendroctonus ponderosae TaxID=77166 RepID=UPI002035E304